MEISTKLRRAEGSLFHWCEPCARLHPLPLGRGWTYDDKFDALTAKPSFRHTWGASCCHYILTKGVLNYCTDCSHGAAGKSLPLPDLPDDFRDFEQPVGRTA
jgi:Family of unknown function (DUF6527)